MFRPGLPLTRGDKNKHCHGHGDVERSGNADTNNGTDLQPS